MKYLLQVTNEDIIRIAAALNQHADILAEMGSDEALDNPEERHLKEWAENESHDVERLYLRMLTLAHTVQAAQALADGNRELASQRADLAGKALADYERMTV